MDGYQIVVINIVLITLWYSGVALSYELFVFWSIFIECTGKNFIQLTIVLSKNEGNVTIKTIKLNIKINVVQLKLS